MREWVVKTSRGKKMTERKKERKGMRERGRGATKRKGEKFSIPTSFSVAYHT